MQEVLPKASKATRALPGNLITTTLSAVGKTFSESPRTFEEIEAYAEVMADMFCAYLRGLKHARKPEIAGKATFDKPTYEDLGAVSRRLNRRAPEGREEE